MKNEIYLKLNPIERQLKSALISNFARLSAKEFDAFCAVYAENYGTGLTKNEKNCNVCRLKALKKMANDYFQYQEWYQGRWGRKPEEPKPVETEPVETEPVIENEAEGADNNKVETDSTNV